MINNLTEKKILPLRSCLLGNGINSVDNSRDVTKQRQNQANPELNLKSKLTHRNYLIIRQEIQLKNKKSSQMENLKKKK